MADEYLRALSWEAATERLEAAGSVPVKEAELMKEALSSEDAGIEVSSRCFQCSPLLLLLGSLPMHLF